MADFKYFYIQTHFVLFTGTTRFTADIFFVCSRKFTTVTADTSTPLVCLLLGSPEASRRTRTIFWQRNKVLICLRAPGAAFTLVSGCTNAPLVRALLRDDKENATLRLDDTRAKSWSTRGYRVSLRLRPLYLGTKRVKRKGTTGSQGVLPPNCAVVARSCALCGSTCVPAQRPRRSAGAASRQRGDRDQRWVHVFCPPHRRVHTSVECQTSLIALLGQRVEDMRCGGHTVTSDAWFTTTCLRPARAASGSA